VYRVTDPAPICSAIYQILKNLTLLQSERTKSVDFTKEGFLDIFKVTGAVMQYIF
jgi:hypothetical protein